MRNSWVGLLGLMVACGNKEPAGPRLPDGGSQTVIQNNIEYRGETLSLESFPVQIATNVRLTNPGSAPASLTFPDGCVVMLLVFRDAARSELAFDSRKVYGCTAALVPVTLAPGASKTFSGPTISAATILGDSLPNGTYYFSALIRPEGTALKLAAGSAALAK